MSGKGKVTQAQLTARLDKVVDLLLLPLGPSEIFQYISEKTDWKITKRQVENYIHDATQLIRDASKVDREYEIGKSLNRLERLYKSNLTIQDYKAALATLKVKIDMLGLDEPTKLDLTTKGEKITWKQLMQLDSNDEDIDV
jgi:hypothetical protein